MNNALLSVDEALKIVRQHQGDFGTEEVDLLASVGRVLAQPVTADRDFPPFNRVTMDGIAINAASFSAKTVAFPVEKVQAAGAPQLRLENPENCLEVMTGAMLPENTDAVIPYEQTAISEGIATIKAEHVKPWQFVHLQGSDCKAGELLIQKGLKITPAMIGTMASVGLHKVSVFKLPTIAICSTGDELVDISEKPLPHQIRRSNSFMLAAELLKEGIKADLFHLPDEPEAMEKMLQPLLEKYDAILFSGAVSKGKFDFLPEVLAQLGMQQLFHKVAQKPGKPFLFGVFANKTIAFGFPGNPVSTFVCYHLYFKEWLKTSLNFQTPEFTAQLSETILFKPDLTYHLPVKLEAKEGVLVATPTKSSGSGDLTSILNADALVTLPSIKEEFQKGETFPIRFL